MIPQVDTQLAAVATRGRKGGAEGFWWIGSGGRASGSSSDLLGWY